MSDKSLQMSKFIEQSRDMQFESSMVKKSNS